MFPQLAMLAFSMIQGSQAASAQNAAYSQNAESAINANAFDNRGINAGLREDQEINAAEQRNIRIQSLELQSQAMAAGRELVGSSVDRDMQHIDNRASAAMASLQATLEGAQRQAGAEKQGTASKAQSRINSVSRQKYNPMGDIARTGLAIHGDYKDSKATFESDLANKGKTYGFKDYATQWLS